MFPPDKPQPIAGLELAEPLGRGAFGAVFRARHPALDIDVAVKLIDIHALAGGDVGKVLREARLMARLDHPNLLRVLDAGQTDDAVYLVLELMDGGSCKGLRLLPPADALDVTRQLLSGLQALHDARVLHRDIKPANCLRRARDGRVKLADLGIAAEWVTTADYDCSGTLPFMAPELFEHPPRVGPAADLYALGMTLACVVLPDDPFPAGPFAVVREWVTSGTRPRVSDKRPDLPAALAALVDRMIAPDPRGRPASAAEALAALSGVAAPAPEPNRSAGASSSSEASTAAHEAASTADPFKTVSRTERVCGWVVGEQHYESSNWAGHAAYHAQTGQAARIMMLQPDGPLGRQSDSILAAAERASRLSHPGVIVVIDWGFYRDRAFVVTAPQGRTIRSLVDEGRPLDEPTAIAFLASLTEALAYLHGRGLVYQLVDPGSTAVRGDARSAILSWPSFCAPAGAPLRTPEGKPLRFFVPRYAAPEIQAGAATIEPSVDLYGLGVTFFYALVGERAYLEARAAGALGDVRARAPAVTARFARLLTELLNPDPLSRPTAAQARAELGVIARQLGIPLAEPTN